MRCPASATLAEPAAGAYPSAALISHIASMATASNCDAAKAITIVAHTSSRFRRRIAMESRVTIRAALSHH